VIAGSEQLSVGTFLVLLRNYWICAFVSAAIGAIVGASYGEHRVTLAIAAMKAKWGWVCGTGLHIPVYFWTIVGALLGAFLGLQIRRILLGRARASSASTDGTMS
jgi:hypothetical protein